MSSNSRVTKSKGKSDGLSLPVRTRPRRKPTNMESDDGNTALNTTPTTMDYTTQGDPNQVAPPTYINTAQTTMQNQFFHTNNFLFQTVATDAFMKSGIKSSMPDT